jgi:hypothetical protein
MITIRHACGYLFFLLGAWCGYLLALRMFRKQWIALLGMAMLLLQPRIFAHAFFNSKDVPFLVALLIALYAISYAFERRRVFAFILAGAACGYATGIRTIGLLPLMLTGILMLRDLYLAKGRSRKQIFGHVLAFGLSALLALYISWPALWHDPLHSMAYTILRLSRYTAWPGSLLLNGQAYPAAELPWYYAPEWFAISTPVVWLMFGVAAIALGCRRLLKKPLIGPDGLKARMLLICAGCFALPLIAVIALHSVLYDDWRHLYFIYPPFVMLALYAAEKLAATARGGMIVAIAAGVQIVATMAFMVSAHPLQQVYFNSLVPHSPEYLRLHFDCDYWGVSYGEGLRYILENDPRDTIPIVNSDSPLEDNGWALPAADQRRLRWTKELQHGAYFLATFRYHPQDYPWPKVWGLRIGNSTVQQIYRVDTALKP